MVEVESENLQWVRFEGRVMIVTGMGREHALLLASRGAKVLVNDAGVSTFKGGSGSSGPAEEVTREIIEAGGEAVASSDSVVTPEGSQAIIDAAVRKWGRIDGVLHNAGIARFGPIEDTDIQDYRDVVAVNLDAAFYLTKSAWPIMREQNYGKFLYITSAGGLVGGAGNTPYAIAKTGMLGLMNVVRFEGAPHNIAVNMLGVGAQTRMVENMWDDSDDGRRME